MARRDFFQTRHSATPNQLHLLFDVIDFMDALQIEKALLAGFDWGARSANIVAALWPDPCQSARFRQRVSDRQPGSRQTAITAANRAPVVVPVLFIDSIVAVQVTRSTVASSRSRTDRPLRRNGSSTTPPLIAAPLPSITRIMSTLSSTTIGGGWEWLKASRNTTS